jgi:hypothetical protein
MHFIGLICIRQLRGGGFLAVKRKLVTVIEKVRRQLLSGMCLMMQLQVRDC